ncbi:Isopentenyl-diphosphate delta-isomerase 1 [Giardia muris]|uniref:isopentenyl-diphosphate Delta-isomerase n=1 Tax=Giardia muris TaxID=5742 RepID=A0A4Z1STF0_GIAMU|nr:Isopentenyl-diphosphate delta-isomerase 1 [Giardia muris]|eukprot:TNJ26918.1 Isopentenyl-diphosphate delta-isomerase 1 [Giardia muris]
MAVSAIQQRAVFGAQMAAMCEERLLLVNERDEIVGNVSKLEAHIRPNVLHRAFSVIVVGPEGELLLQRRASSKLTFPSLISNTCCSHPLYSVPGDEEGIMGVKRAACRRLLHEVGLALQPSELIYVGTLCYNGHSNSTVWIDMETMQASNQPFPNSAPHTLYEAEMDYILLHFALDRASISLNSWNPTEVSELFWCTETELCTRWSEVTPWFYHIYDRFLGSLLRDYLDARRAPEERSWTLVAV